jgi:sec-independent protein translocase protein TatC
MALPDDQPTPGSRPAYVAPNQDEYPSLDGLIDAGPDPAPAGPDAGSAIPPPADPPPPPFAGSPESPKPPEEEEDDPEEQGMLRMSFLEHLEELRTRLIRIVAGLGISFAASLTFSNWLWEFVSAPAVDALKQLKANPPNLITLDPVELLTIVWWKMPFICSIFLAAPWILWQVWAFIAPGLYRKERRFAGPFVLASGFLFILGGLFAYFVAFRFGLVFLLGFSQITGLTNITQNVTVQSYFDLFVNVILGVSVVFELPMVVFLAILLRITNTSFLMKNSRYAILLIVLMAAVITPTADAFNLALFSAPMILLYFAGVFAGYLVELERSDRRFPWAKVLGVLLFLLLVLLGTAVVLTAFYGFRLVNYWPFLVK